MTKRWIGWVPCASIALLLAASCGSSDGGGAAGGAGGGAGLSGAAGSSQGGRAGSGEAGTAPTDNGGAAGAFQPHDSAGAAGDAASDGGSSSDEAGAGGSAGSPEEVPQTAPPISDLAFWMNGRAQSYSDLDENYPTPADSGRIRSIPESAPLTGHWQATTSAERPIRERGALSLKPIETRLGYNLKNDTGILHTDGSTLAISFRPLNGAGNPAQGAISGPIGDSAQSLGIFFAGSGVGLYFNHTAVVLKKKLVRGAHTTIIVRFTATGANVEFDIDGTRSSESVAATVAHEAATNFVVGYDSNYNADIYGFVSQAIGVDRSVSDGESADLMDWLVAQPIPAAFAVSRPLVAINGDSIANGDQVPGWQSWAFSMLAKLSDVDPDVQLLNAAVNGAGIPKSKNSDYSDVVLPWFSTKRAKNILIVAAGSNDIAGGNNLQDMLDRYYGLLDSARATGWKTVACTILPRSDATLALGKDGFEAERAAFNADIVAHWAAHADALADVAAIVGMGAPADSDNLKYYGADKIHPNVAGHALLEPVYRAAVASLL